MDPSPPPLGQALEHTMADGFGGLFGCGTSMVSLVFVIIVLLALLFFIAKWHLAFLKDISATLAALKEAIYDKRN